MEIDYTTYGVWYSYMNNMTNVLGQMQNITSQLQNISNLYGGSSVTGTGGSQSFAETFQGASQSTAKKLGVPESMDDIFEEAAEKYNVPSALLKAIGKAESGFRADAVSSAGAQGVMQLMPATAKALGVTDPFDARSNIMGGAKYIAEKLKKYDGDIELALAAYNAGSGNVAKYGGVPPFKETQNYIRKVKEYMGEDLTTGKTVVTQGTSGIQNGTGIQNNLDSLSDITEEYSEVIKESARYMLELMKLQMQTQTMSASQSLLNFTDSSLW